MRATVQVFLVQCLELHLQVRCFSKSHVVRGLTASAHSSIILTCVSLISFFHIAAQGISQVGTFLETFSAARVAAYSALKAINRKPGRPEEIIYYDPDDEKDESMSRTSRSVNSVEIETPEGRVKAILPAFEIDSFSEAGLKPENVQGQLSFDGVKFVYPTRPGHTILDGLSVDIPAGKTIA